MKRKVYEKPTTQVVKLQPTQMLQGSKSIEVKATMNDTWEEEDL